MRVQGNLAIMLGLLALSAGCLTFAADPAHNEGNAGEEPDAESGGSVAETRANPCLEHGGGSTSGNAPALPAFLGDPAQVAARFARAVEDPLASTEPDESRSDTTLLQWDTESGGTVGYQSSLGDLVALHWTRGGRSGMDEPEARAFLDETLRRLDVPASQVTPPTNTNPGGVNLLFRQTFRGEPVQSTGGTFATDVSPILMLQPFRDLSQVDVRIGAEEAEGIARARMRCELDQEGKTEAAGYVFKTNLGRTWAVSHDSLVHAFHLEYEEPGNPGHCGLVYVVEVDAGTGAVMWGRPPCD